MIIVLMLPIYCEEDMRESPNQAHKSFEIEHAHLYDADPIFLCGEQLTILTLQAWHDPSAFPTYQKNLMLRWL